MLASMIVLAAFGLNLLDQFSLESEENQKYYYAVMDQMLAEGGLSGDEQRLARYQVALFFDPFPEIEPPIGNFGRLLTITEQLGDRVSKRLDATSQAERETTLAGVRQRWPQWIEDPQLYQAVVSDLLNRREITGDLLPHARQKIAEMEAAPEARAYYHQVSQSDQQTLERRLRERATAQIALLNQPQRKELIEAARRRHPAWVVDETLHYAVLWKLREEGAFIDSVQSVVDADLAIHMQDQWEQEFLEQHEEHQVHAWRGEAIRKVNERILLLDEEARTAAITEASAANPNWLADEEVKALRQMMEEEGLDGTFGNALLATFGLFDLLWFALAVTTAYSVSIRQGD